VHAVQGAHTRSLVAVGAVISKEPTGHGVHGAQLTPSAKNPFAHVPHCESVAELRVTPPPQFGTGRHETQRTPSK